jgi:hypothetical protein
MPLLTELGFVLRWFYKYVAPLAQLLLPDGGPLIFPPCFPCQTE